ncbi:segregation and condensation protein A [Kaarinaea lacus]
MANDTNTETTDQPTQDSASTEESLNSNEQQALPDNVIPLAIVRGTAFTDLPQDLYIPPDALEVFLEAFEGPLDLLLYLIKRQNLDILDIPIAEITRQYMEYVEMMKDLRLELAADYLVMAAMLAEIKSRMLLPRPVEEEDEEDPRAELIRRLQEYERFKKAAEDLNEMPRLYRDVFQVVVNPPDYKSEKPQPEVEMRELLLAFRDVLKRAEMYTHHQIQLEPLSVRERMSNVLEQVKNNPGFLAFNKLFTYEEGRRGVVVTFLAILELLKELLIEIVQTEPYGPIHIKAAEKCQ